MLSDLRYRLRALFRRGRVEQDLDDELRFHLDEQIDALVRAGLTPEQARRRAALDFGGLAQVKEDTRDAWGLRLIDTAIQDVAYACRTLTRTPGFTLTALLTLTIGVSLNTIVATMGMTMMWRTWPVPAADDLVILSASRPDGRALGSFSWEDYQRLSDRATTATIVATGCGMDGRAVNCRFELEGGESTLGQFVSGRYFAALEIPVARGRGLTVADDRRDAPAAAVISDSLWRRSFAGDPAILGRSIELDGVPFAIVGVTAGSFAGTSLVRRDVWVPVAASPILRPSTRAALSGLEVIARLRPGVSRAQARAEFDAILAEPSVVRRIELSPTSFYAHPNDRQEVRVFFAIALTAAVLVLLVACANVGNLLLARTAARRREVAIRLAIGASRPRLVRQFLTESLVLAALAAGASLWVARIVPGAILAAAFAGKEAALAMPVTPDWRVALFGGVLATITCLAFGLTPALQASRVDVLPALAGRAGGFGRTPLRSWLLGVQVAVSVVLLGSSSLLARGLAQAYSLDRGFSPAGVTMLSFELPASYDISERQSFESALIETAHELASRSDAAIATAPPFSGWMNYVPVPLRASPSLRRIVPTVVTEVSPGYFSTLGIPHHQGRILTTSDAGHHRIVINEALARLFEDRLPLGEVLFLGPAGERTRVPHEIVGVVGTVDHGEGPGPAAYELLGSASEWLWTTGQDRQQPPRLLFRDAAVAAAPSTVAAMRRVDPRARAILSPLTASVDERYAEDRFSVRLAGAVGLMALCLASIGVCGSFAYAVRQQTREIGVRRALGGRPPGIILSIVRSAGRSLGIGLVTGLAGAALAGQVLRRSLFGLSPLDPLTYLAVTVLVAAAALAALAVPAWRATRIAPADVLRAD